MARPVVITKALATAASATKIAGSQSPLAAGLLTLVANPVTLDTARRVIITSGGDDRTANFTIIGTNQTGNQITETFAGSNGSTAQSSLDYLTIISIAISEASASTVEAGTNGVGSTQWVSVSPHLPTTELSVTCEVTGTVNYTVQYTYQDLNYNPTSFYAYQLDNVIPSAFADGLVVGATTTQVAVQNDPITGARVLINSGMGSVKATFLQAGIAGP